MAKKAINIVQNWESTERILQAVKEGEVNQLSALLEAGYSANYVSLWSESEYNPLYQAAENNQLECVRILVKHGADVNFVSYLGYTPLHAAVQSNNLAIVEFLFSNGAKVSTIEENRSPFYQSPLMLAAKQGNIEIAKFLIEHDADVNELGGAFGKATALTYAVESENIAMMQFLIAHGAQVNTLSYAEAYPSLIDGYSSSPLFIATLMKNQEAINLLLNAGANDLGWSSLHTAIATQNLEKAQAFIEQDNSLVNTQDLFGLYPAHYALLAQDVSFLNLLAKHAADMDLSSSMISLLHAAVFLDVPSETFCWVAEHTENIDFKTEKLSTALGIAAEQGRIEHITILLEKGADPNVKSGQYEMTPLHLAVDLHQFEAVKILLSHPNIDINLQDGNGRTPLEYAKNFGEHKNIIELLETTSLSKASLLNIDDMLFSADPISEVLEISSPKASAPWTPIHSMDQGSNYFATPVSNIESHVATGLDIL